MKPENTDPTAAKSRTPKPAASRRPRRLPPLASLDKLKPSLPDESLPDEIIRTGKDELNLIEHPFAAMWDKEGNEAVIHHEWDARHPITGKTLRASWRVEGSPTMGLPKPNDERVYLVLLELTREARFQDQAVYFTRYDLIKRLGWPHNERHYQMLYDAFERLKAVNITAKNAFWEPRAKSFRNIGFSIIDNFDILNEKPGRKSRKSEQAELPMSYFRWNEVMFHSFQSGYMRTLNLGLALSFKGDIALRLYRYLDKKSYDGRRSFQIELAALCERHLGMRPAQYPSKHKERLKGAHNELIQHGVIESVTYQPMKNKKADKVCYLFPAETLALPVAEADVLPANSKEVLAALQTPQPIPDVLQRMLDLKISPDVARALLQSKSQDQLIVQLECLADRMPQDFAAVFVKAVREDWAPPAKYFERQKAVAQAQKAKEAAELEKSREAAEEVSKNQDQALAAQEADTLNMIWEKLDVTTQKRLEEQVREELEKSEFLRVRLETGKLTKESPDWVKARHTILRKMLAATGE